jgi:Domain of unknown function (DUF4062)
MPKTVTLFRLFIASPSDVKEERMIVQKTVDELNVTFTPQANIKIEVINWEKNVYPGVGDDAQHVVNKVINDDYDIFIGIMFSRFGTPTKRDSSGTKEEFERAYNNYSKEKLTPSIMIYFKNGAIEFDDIIPDQISAIQSFKENLKSKGVLYKDFKQVSDFEQMFRLNLTLLLHNLASQTIELDNQSSVFKISDSENSEPTNDLSVVQKDEIGFFEAIDSLKIDIEDVLSALSRIVSYMSQLTLKTDQKTARIEKANTKTPDVKFVEIRKIFDQLADDMKDFNSLTQVEIPILSECFFSFVKNFNDAIIAYYSVIDDENERLAFAQGLTNLKDSIRSASTGMNNLKTIISSTPLLTTKFGKAKKENSQVLTQITKEFDTYINLIEELENSVSEK